MTFRLTLKGRFILVAAGAVAAVALAITAVAFLAIRTDLQNQVHQQVASRADRSSAQACSSTGTYRTTGSAALVRVRAASPTPRSITRPAPSGPAGRRRAAHAERGRHRGGGGQRGPFYGSPGSPATRAMVYTDAARARPRHPGGRAADLNGPGGRERRRVLAALSAIGVLVPPCSAGPWPDRAGAGRQAGRRGRGGHADRRPGQAGRGRPPGRARPARHLVQRHAGRAAASLDAQRRLVSDASHELAPARRACGSTSTSSPRTRTCPPPSARGPRRSPTRSRSSAAWWPASPTWPGASRRVGTVPVRLDPVAATPWTRPAATGRRPSSTPTSTAA